MVQTTTTDQEQDVNPEKLAADAAIFMDDIRMAESRLNEGDISNNEMTLEVFLDSVRTSRRTLENDHGLSLPSVKEIRSERDCSTEKALQRLRFMIRNRVFNQGGDQ